MLNPHARQVGTLRSATSRVVDYGRPFAIQSRQPGEFGKQVCPGRQRPKGDKDTASPALVLAKAINFMVQPLGNQVTQHAEHDRRGEPEQEQAIDRFEWAQELPPLRQMNVPVTQ